MMFSCWLSAPFFAIHTVTCSFPKKKPHLKFAKEHPDIPQCYWEKDCGLITLRLNCSHQYIWHKKEIATETVSGFEVVLRSPVYIICE